MLFICLLVIYIPFHDTGHLFKSYQTEHVFFFVIVLISVLLVRSLVALFPLNKSIAIKISWTDLFLLVFILHISFSHFCISKMGGLTLKYLSLISLSAFYIYLRILPRYYYNYLLFSLLVSGIIQSVYGNLQLWGIYPSNHHLFNITGSFFNPGPYAGYLSIILPIALAIYLHTLKTIPNNSKQPQTTPNHPKPSNPIPNLTKYLSLLTIITIILVLPSTRSRASWFAAFGGSIFIMDHYYPFRSRLGKYFNTSWKKLLAITATFVFMGGLSAGIYFMKKGSADGRLLIWKVSARLINEKPLFGYGHEKFKAYYMAEQAEYFRLNPGSRESFVADDIIYPFNEFIKGLTELGIAGMSPVIVMVFFFFFLREPQPREKKDVVLMICQAGVLSFMIFSFFSYPTEILPVLINLVIILSITAGQVKHSKMSDFMGFQLTGRKAKLFRLLASTVILILVFTSLSPLKKLYLAYFTWEEGYRIYQMGAYEDCLDSFEKAYPLLKNNGEFLIMYGKALSMAEEHYVAVKVLETAKNYQQNTILYTALGDSYKALGEFTRAESSYLQANNMIPGRFYSKYLLARLYIETGQTKKAKSTAREILKKEVKVPSRAIEEIRAEMEKILE
ncbi:MAG: O-antigen ligase family protein [Bacteroidales bacterium]|nr:O-antigen ligase family protein [Bacteroidales bacterium]